MGNKFSSGKNSIAVCDRCGAQYKLSELRKETKKLKTYNLLVCKSCWDPDHPQLQLGMFPVDDPQAVRDPRKDTSYYGVSGSRLIQWGWAPMGGASSIDAPLTPNDLAMLSKVGQVTVVTT
jgi:hypothetical protein